MKKNLDNLYGLKVSTSPLIKNEVLFIPEIWSKKLLEKFYGQIDCDILKGFQFTSSDLIRLASERIAESREKGMDEEAIKKDLEAYMAGLTQRKDSASATATERITINPRMTWGVNFEAIGIVKLGITS